jgi:hypothetical protein
MVAEKTEEAPLDTQGTEAADTAYQSAQDPADAPVAEASTEAPADAPPSEPTAEPPAEPVAPETPADLGTIERLQKQVSDFQEQQAQSHLVNEANEYKAWLVQNGQDEQTSTQIAEQHYSTRMQAWGNFKAQTDLKTAYEGRLDSALRIAEETGVSAREADMQRAASTEKRISDLETENKRLKLEGVPAQKLDSAIASPTAVSSNASNLDRYNEGARDEAATAAAAQVVNG